MTRPGSPFDSVLTELRYYAGLRVTTGLPSLDRLTGSTALPSLWVAGADPISWTSRVPAELARDIASNAIGQGRRVVMVSGRDSQANVYADLMARPFGVGPEELVAPERATAIHAAERLSASAPPVAVIGLDDAIEESLTEHLHEGGPIDMVVIEDVGILASTLRRWLARYAETFVGLPLRAQLRAFSRVRRLTALVSLRDEMDGSLDRWSRSADVTLRVSASSAMGADVDSMVKLGVTSAVGTGRLHLVRTMYGYRETTDPGTDPSATRDPGETGEGVGG